jgi:NhaP-type Na+/H+ and K+/H+ antiporter
VETPIWLRRRLITTVAGITGCIAVVIAVLWVRVSLETVVVVFNMAKSLASIDDAIGDGRR